MAFKYKSNADEILHFEVLPPGNYRFEIIGIDNGVSSAGKTAGWDYREFKLAVYTDDFQSRAAQITTRITFPPDESDRDCFNEEKIRLCTFLEAKLISLIKCTGWKPKGAELTEDFIIQTSDFDENSTLGLRGWCTLGKKQSERDKDKFFNEVLVWLTNKEKLPRNTPAPKVDPFAAKPAEDSPENW